MPFQHPASRTKTLFTFSPFSTPHVCPGEACAGQNTSVPASVVPSIHTPPVKAAATPTPTLGWDEATTRNSGVEEATFPSLGRDYKRFSNPCIRQLAMHLPVKRAMQLTVT